MYRKKLTHFFTIILAIIFIKLALSPWLFYEAEAAGKVAVASVPFTSQAPLAKWSDMRQEDGCEEASSLMAMLWAKGKKSIKPADVEKEIIAISEYEKKYYGSYNDTSTQDTVKRIINGYYKYDKAQVKTPKSAKDIIAELEKGNIVIVPANGQKLKNPNYKRPGASE